MKVSVIGCSTCWTDRPTSSYCINDNTLVDCGEGTMKFYKLAGVDFLSINKIFLTHFHADHTLNLIQYLCQYANYSPVEKRKTVTIYGPSGLKKYLDCIKAISIDCVDLVWEDYFNIVEIDDFAREFDFGNLKVKPYKFTHGKIENIGYVFKDEKCSVGFSGDLNFQESIEKFLKECDNVFLECCAMKSSAYHLGYDKYIEFQNQMPDKKFFATHCVDDVYNREKELNITCAKYGQTYNF